MPGWLTRRLTHANVTATLAALAILGTGALTTGALTLPAPASGSAVHVCDSLLDRHEALHAMGETEISFEEPDFSHGILQCSFGGSTPGEQGRMA